MSVGLFINSIFSVRIEFIIGTPINEKNPIHFWGFESSKDRRELETSWLFIVFISLGFQIVNHMQTVELFG